MKRDNLEFLKRNGLVGPRELRQEQAQELGFGFVDLERVPLSPELLRIFPRELLAEHRVLPLKQAKGTLWVAMEEPSQGAAEAIEEICGCRVVPVLSTPGAVDAAIARL